MRCPRYNNVVFLTSINKFSHELYYSIVLPNYIVLQYNCQDKQDIVFVVVGEWKKAGKDRELLLGNVLCFLASRGQQRGEQVYYRDIFGLQCDFLFADSMEEARSRIVSQMMSSLWSRP